MKTLSIALFFFLLCCAGYAQSTLEYAALLSRQSAVGSVKKEKAPVPQGADSAGVLLRGGALLQQAGQQAGAGFGVAPEPETKPAVAEGEKGLVKVYLKSGQVIEGKLVEQGDDHVKVEAEGIVVTYFNEEIDKIA
jgi:hypothetical protein